MGYADSAGSSPRSRGPEPPWDEPSPAPAKLRLMCSYGGRIVPRPTDKSLCYLGGETRIVSVDRCSLLADLTAKLAKILGGRPFALKYQLPSEDLDSLVSVATDEDLDNMIDEYDRSSSRLRLFLFPTEHSSSPASSIGSLLDDSKSETWFVDALNGALAGGSFNNAESASVNSLLGLDDDASVHSASEHDPPRRPDKPESPMMDATSSFGSASSFARVHSPEKRIGGGIQENFARMNLKGEEVPIFHPEDPQQQKSAIFHPEDPQQQKSAPVQPPAPDSSTTRPIYYQEKSLPVNPIPAQITGYPQPQQQQQQFLHNYGPGTVPAYYQMQYPIQQQQQQRPQFDPQVGMYYVPVRPNPSYNLVDPATKPESANLYRTQQGTVVQLAGDQAYPYAGMGYHHPSRAANYGYEFADSTNQPQVYYTAQSAALHPQYQTVLTDSTSQVRQIQQGEVKQTRG